MRAQLTRLLHLWESAQVELHGKYSVERVRKLVKYASETSYAHAMLVMLVTPLPCLVVTILVDALPLADPSEGVAANKMFFVRSYFNTFVLTFIATNQFRVTLPAFPYPMKKALWNAVWISAVIVGIMWASIMMIGFPLPFTMMFLTPSWATLLSISLAIEWSTTIRETPGGKAMMINMIKVWMCQVVLEFVYPPYYFVFTTLSDMAQMAFALLLPVFKLVMRNVFVRTVVHLKDELPEVVVSNVEVFNALFVSYCMQNSPSFWTTLELMCIDIGMIALSVHDMEKTRIGLKDLERRIDEEKNCSTYCNAINYTTMGTRVPTTLQRTRILWEEDYKQEAKAPHELATNQGGVLAKRGKNAMGVRSLVMVVAKFQTAVKPSSLLMHSTSTSSSRYNATVVPRDGTVKRAMKKMSVKVRYTRKVQRLLYMAEFLLLLNYIEVAIPLIFSIYMLATYMLPNREYYAQLRGMTQNELMQTLVNVLFYCLLQLGSLLLLVFILHKKLGLPPIHQLAFVLEKQSAGVQIRMIFWVFYHAQASLQHQGYDYFNGSTTRHLPVALAR